MAENVEEEQSPSKLIAFRCALLALFVVSFFSNVYSSVFHIQVIVHYSQCTGCKFTTYEALVLAATLGMLIILLIGVYVVLTQRLRALRGYTMSFFLSSWLQMLLILLLTQRYPIAHDVHFKWQQHESIAEIENKFRCCGVLGPDDYLLDTGTLPSSCFIDHSNVTKDLHYEGCLNKENATSNMLRYEFVTCVFQLILLFFLVMFYLHLKKIKAPERSLRSVWQSRIIF